MTLTCVRKFRKSYKFSSPRQSCVRPRDRSPIDSFFLCSEDPAWKRLIAHTPTTHERISLITTIFSDDNQAEMVRNLSGNDAQDFIDVVDEVSLRTLPSPNGGWVDSNSNFRPLSFRCWIVFHHRPARSVCPLCTTFVAAKSWFRDHW